MVSIAESDETSTWVSPGKALCVPVITWHIDEDSSLPPYVVDVLAKPFVRNDSSTDMMVDAFKLFERTKGISEVWTLSAMRVVLDAAGSEPYRPASSLM